MTCDWQSEHGWCEYPSRGAWLQSRKNYKSEGRHMIESMNIKCVDMLERCKL